MKNSEPRLDGWMTRISDLVKDYRFRLAFDGFVSLVIVMITIYIFSPNLQAEWWIVDDHEIISYIGEDQAFSFQEIIPTLLTKTEINPGSTIVRFRPAYFFLRLLETRLWVNIGPLGWYLTRMVIFAFFIFSLFHLFSFFNGRLVGALLAVFCSSLTLWVDIFARLGPGEAYAALGTGLFIFGLPRAMSKNADWFAWGLMFTGLIISTGSKENMIILWLPYLLMWAISIRKNPRSWPAWFALVLGGFWTTWIYASLLPRMKTTGADIFSLSVSPAYRIEKAFEVLDQYWLAFGVVISFTLIALVLFIRLKDQQKRQSAFVALSGFLITPVLVVSQIVFYAGGFKSRYLFPVFMAIPLLVSMSLFMFQKIVETKKVRHFQALVTFTACIGLLVGISPANWVKMREFGYENVEHTHLFMDKVEEIGAILIENPDYRLVFFGTTPIFDYEPIDSYEQFLRAQKVNNSFYVLRDPPSDYLLTYSAFAIRLEEELQRKSEMGDPTWTISPWSEFENHPRQCLMILLKADHMPPIQCDLTVDGDVLYFDQNYLVSW